MDAKFEEFIGVFENAVPSDVCQHLINYFDIHETLNKTINRQNQGAYKVRKNDTLLGMAAETDPMVLKTFTMNMQPLADVLDDCYKQYIGEYDILAQLSRHRISQTYQIQKTRPGEGYHIWHCEADNLTAASRIAVPIVYLNDVEEGGETEFLYQKMRIKPTEGTVVLFPAGYTHVHRGNPPLSGTKYIVTTWIEFLG
jgi:2OG-Fe(II) oxygenase superfamily